MANNRADIYYVIPGAAEIGLNLRLIRGIAQSLGVLKIIILVIMITFGMIC